MSKSEFLDSKACPICNDVSWSLRINKALATLLQYERITRELIRKQNGIILDAKAGKEIKDYDRGYINGLAYAIRWEGK